VALRDIAITLKRWAQAHQMMGNNYPSRPDYDSAIIRSIFGAAGVPHVTQILQDRHVAYIGINELKDEIIIYTRKKLTAPQRRALSHSAITLGGTHVSLIFKHGGVPHAGWPPVSPIVSPSYMHTDRHACGGSVYIGSEKGAGTLGCLVRSSDGTLYGLSNNHVTGGSNYAVPGLPIIAPGFLDVAAFGQDPETIGHHFRSYPFIDGIPEVVDCSGNLDAAIFKISDPDRVSSMQRSYYDTPSEAVPMEVGMRVSKIGRTTGLTHGEVVSELPDAEFVEYEVDVCKGKKFIYFQSLFLIQATPGEFTQGGDSGSLITAPDPKEPKARRAVGMVIGGDDTGLSFALSLDRVLKYFDVTLVSGHNV
jgi:hypothetical protein